MFKVVLGRGVEDRGWRGWFRFIGGVHSEPPDSDICDLRKKRSQENNQGFLFSFGHEY